VQLAPEKHTLKSLESPEGAGLLRARIEQHPHRHALRRTLGAEFTGPEGDALGLDELLRTITRHGLAPALFERERESVMGAFAEQRGAIGRAAWVLALRPAELKSLVLDLGLEQAIEGLRERFRREVLSPRNLASLLDQLGRTRYLEDLGIREQVTQLARSQLRSLLESGRNPPTPLKNLAESEGVPLSQLQRVLESLGLPRESAPPEH
jgi:hypothetical protein